jgi:hypothetical protein
MSKLLEYLHELVPASCSIADAFHLTADAVLESLSSVGIQLKLTSIADLFESDPDDDALAAVVFDHYWHFHEGQIVIHSPACSRYGLPDFECAAEELQDFIHGYNREMLFDGDVLFLARKSRTLTVFHHEGAFGHCRLPPSAASTPPQRA